MLICLGLFIDWTLKYMNILCQQLVRLGTVAVVL